MVTVKLETSLEAGNLVEFCRNKVASLQPDTQEARLWSFIAASFRLFSQSQHKLCTVPTSVARLWSFIAASFRFSQSQHKLCTVPTSVADPHLLLCGSRIPKCLYGSGSEGVNSREEKLH